MGTRTTYALYNACLALAAPAAKAWLSANVRYRPLLGRFTPAVPPPGGECLWVHACSVGEVNTARPVLAALSERFPALRCLLTSSTVTGRALADQVQGAAGTAWCPFDTRKALHRFLDCAKPRALVLIETELWPNMLRECRLRGIPVVVINGRLSDKHFARYRKHAWLTRLLFEQVTAVGAQNSVYAERFTALGAAPARVEVTGNTKFDAVTTRISPRIRTRLRAELGWSANMPAIVFGSTRPGDEELAAACWKRLSAGFPGLKMVVAPRHLERADEAASCFGPVAVRRSALREARARAEECRVLILDTLGELTSFYSLAAIAVIGGSFFPGVNGHNPLEPAALGAPTVFGPYMSNFPDPARVLTAAGGAIQLDSPEPLCEWLEALLRDPGQCRRLGTSGRKAVLSQQGAIARNVDMIARVLAEWEGK